jgi:hypothetical protein
MELGEMTFYTKLQPLEQFEIVMMLALMCFLSAIILREYFTDREIRIAGRVLGLAGFSVLAAFSWRMAATVEKLEQIARVQRVQEIADQGFAVARKPDSKTTWDSASITTPDGTTISFSGRESSVQSHRRRQGSEGSGSSSTGTRGADGSQQAWYNYVGATGADHAINAMPHAVPMRFIQ